MKDFEKNQIVYMATVYLHRSKYIDKVMIDIKECRWKKWKTESKKEAIIEVTECIEDGLIYKTTLSEASENILFNTYHESELYSKALHFKVNPTMSDVTLLYYEEAIEMFPEMFI